jgi:hypothetical protein
MREFAVGYLELAEGSTAGKRRKSQVAQRSSSSRRFPAWV